jgi:hypothetical protein
MQLTSSTLDVTRALDDTRLGVELIDHLLIHEVDRRASRIGSDVRHPLQRVHHIQSVDS